MFCVKNDPLLHYDIRDEPAEKNVYMGLNRRREVVFAPALQAIHSCCAVLTKNHRGEHLIYGVNGAKVFINNRAQTRFSRILRDRDTVHIDDWPEMVYRASTAKDLNPFLPEAIIAYLVETYDANEGVLRGVCEDIVERNQTMTALMGMQKHVLFEEMNSADVDYLFLELTNKLASSFTGLGKTKMILRAMGNCVMSGTPSAGDVVFDEDDIMNYFDKLARPNTPPPISKKPRTEKKNVARCLFP